MPELSRFYGIIIKMYFMDHNSPHFHAEYGEHRAEENKDPRSLYYTWTLVDKKELIDWMTELTR